ncbi:MAG: radical SAM protein [Lachnospiraceae bacterium]|nr:radical SAM protein [Lachnospiraceae bacterium]
MRNPYIGAVYRPPSEATSLIIQSTIGCSQNRCTFCTMYKEKNFTIKPVHQVIDQIDEYMNHSRGQYQKIFLADGDALIRPISEQLEILNHIRTHYPQIERVSSYGSPRSALNHSVEDLHLLRKAGLKLIYLGLESGCDEVLSLVQKGVCAREIVEASRRLHDAGFELSVTAIIGLGGKKNSMEHGKMTGEVLSKIKPEYIGLLTLMVPKDSLLQESIRSGEFQLLSSEEILLETKEILLNLDSEGSVFRSNHASNYLDLRGTLNQDTPRLLQMIDDALLGKRKLKEEIFRGL